MNRRKFLGGLLGVAAIPLVGRDVAAANTNQTIMKALKTQGVYEGTQYILVGEDGPVQTRLLETVDTHPPIVHEAIVHHFSMDGAPIDGVYFQDEHGTIDAWYYTEHNRALHSSVVSRFPSRLPHKLQHRIDVDAEWFSNKIGFGDALRSSNWAWTQERIIESIEWNWGIAQAKWIEHIPHVEPDFHLWDRSGLRQWHYEYAVHKTKGSN